MDSEINTSKSSKTILSMTGRSEFLRNNFNYFVVFFFAERTSLDGLKF